MADLSQATHAVHAAVAVKPIITEGMSMITLLISNVVTALISVGISWYISHRGMAGVKIDLNNTNNEIGKLTDYVIPPTV